MRDPNDYAQERLKLVRDLPAISATGTYPIDIPAVNGRTFIVERVLLMVDATYAADAANFYAFVVQRSTGPTTMASWSTQTAAQGALTGGTPAAMVLASDKRIPANDIVSLVATKNGAAANITPRIVIHGRLA